MTQNELRRFKYTARRPAFAYKRRSKEDETGNSMAAQEKAIRERFEPEGFEIVRWFSDEHSAFRYSNGRDGISQLMRELDNHPEVKDVLVEQFDRLGRDPDHVGWLRQELKNRNVRIHYAVQKYDASKPDGMIMQQVNTGLSAAESMRIAEKTHSRMLANFRQRDAETGWQLKNGGRPQYGYKIVHLKYYHGPKIKFRSIWEIDESSAAILRRIVVDMRIGRNMSYEEIRDELNADGIPSPEGGLWTKSTMHELFRRDRLLGAAGVAIWNRENKKDDTIREEKGKFKPEEEWVKVENAHPPILTMEEVELATALGAQRGPRTFTPRTDASPYLFSGVNAEGEIMFRCARCGGHMVSYQKSKGKSYYACSHATNQGKNGICGPVVKVSKETLESDIIQQVMARYSSHEFVSLVLERVNDIIQDLNMHGGNELKSLDKAIDQVRRKMNNLLGTLQMTGPSVTLAEAFKAAETEKERLEQKRKALLVEVQPIAPITETELQGLLDNFSEVMQAGTNKQRREMIRAFVSHMIFDPDSRQIEVFFWPSPPLGPDPYMQKAKHIFLCFARISDGGGEASPLKNLSITTEIRYRK
ncbi:recombinase family protein [Alicyclobacillus ferrooxydans]|uniref:Recombinase domain-containing protein n=1 Tax=Alicyclobacillus ferrooxydans TaxID=471514 RepID=A0A0P9EKW8_9BACL|nr:recombinase family protein [Alicyclobacillus ferrooxydans]KPV43835.1 hypothetical protein AN477_10710 [Alicyclobacillus ferrooxydans]